MATKAELRDRAASDLGMLILGQSLQSQDATRINSAYDEVYDQLKDEGLNTWASTGDCPAKVVPYVSALMALNCCRTYRISQARYQRIVDFVGIDGNQGMREIRKLVTPAYESLDDPEDF